MRAEIITTGTELLLGEIVDINSPYLASQLAQLGIDLYWISTVGDNPERMITILKQAWDRSELILTTGGLGPTKGDITRETISSMLGEELQLDPHEERRLRQFFSNRSMDMPASNLKQAMRIPSAQFLHNPNGTAPGWWVEQEGHILIALPGPPGEASSVWTNEAKPRLQKMLGGTIILSRTLKTFGLPEAEVGELIGPLATAANPTLASYAKFDGIHLRITAKADTEYTASVLIGEMEDKVRTMIGEYIWGKDAEVLEEVVGELLIKKQLTVATMESCTGGLLATTLTDVPGSSIYFRGGIVSYSNEIKISSGIDPILIQQHGAINPEVAQAMASVIRKELKSDIGIGITGVAGPSELEGKAAGTVFIGIDDGNRPRVITSNYPGNRKRVKQRATISALIELRKSIIKNDGY
ncbi:competence/damage-inducible protein A [Chloroflexota bacterium]